MEKCLSYVTAQCQLFPLDGFWFINLLHDGENDLLLTQQTIKELIFTVLRQCWSEAECEREWQRARINKCFLFSTKLSLHPSKLIVNFIFWFCPLPPLFQVCHQHIGDLLAQSRKSASRKVCNLSQGFT